MVNPDNKIRFHYSEEGDLGREGNEVKPVEGVKSTKDFKKVLGKRGKESRDDDDDDLKKKTGKIFNVKGRDESDIAVDTSKDDEENASASVSLFELSKNQNSQTEGIADKKDIKAPVLDEQNVSESPQDLFRRMSASKPQKKFAPTEAPNQYVREQPDLSYVNPLKSPIIEAPVPVQEKKPVQDGVQLVDLVTSLIDQLYVVETSGQKDTVFVLQNPPLFSGATVTISAFDSAKGQFNIAFTNLTQEAQKILDMAENRQLLIAGLAEKGYGVQMFTTTTLAEGNPLLPEEASQKREQDEENRREQRENQNKKR